MTEKQLTRSQVESNEYLTKLVREQAAWIRGDVEIGRSVSRGAGAGAHTTLWTVRDFAIRVLVAKGEIKASGARPDFYVAA